jgi:hypothetical protein
VNDVPLASCITAQELAQYFAGALPEARIEQIDQHLLDCIFCFALSEKVADATQDLLEENLLAQELPALEFLEEANVASEVSGEADIRERIRQWIRIGSELAVGIRLPLHEGVAAFLTSGVKNLLAPSPAFTLSLATAGGTRGSGLATDDLQGPILEVPGTREKRARVVVDLTEGTHVSVQIDALPASFAAPLAAIEMKESGETVIKEMTRVESLTNAAHIDLIADFDVPPGVQEIIVLIEPFPS